MPGSEAAPEAMNLRGTIYETGGDWGAAVAAYERARAGWAARPPSPDRAAGLVRATTGVAYGQRKAGQYAEAAATYEQLLALAPTADTHFLLAQFYEDAQQTAKAAAHARRAAQLDPARYRREGDKLINRLTVFQFGCLGI